MREIGSLAAVFRLFVARDPVFFLLPDRVCLVVLLFDFVAVRLVLVCREDRRVFVLERLLERKVFVRDRAMFQIKILFSVNQTIRNLHYNENFSGLSDILAKQQRG